MGSPARRPSSPQEEPELDVWEAIRAFEESGDEADADVLRWGLAYQEYRQVVRLARAYPPARRGDLELADLISAGLLGAYRAIRRFDPAKEVPFAGYAYWWIRQEMQAAIHTGAHTIRLPVSLHRSLVQLREAQRQGAAGEAALEEATGLSPIQQRRILSAAQMVRSLDESDAYGERLVETLEAEGEEATEILGRANLLSGLRRALETNVLEEIHRQILTLRYGLDGRDPMTLEAVGVALNIPNREIVRCMEKRALAQLRTRLMRQGVATRRRKLPTPGT